MKKKQNLKYETDIMHNARIGLTTYPEMEFKPIPLTNAEDVARKSRYDQLIHHEQAQLFGMDMLKPY